MNRVLLAEVILTLTREQAERLLVAVEHANEQRAGAWDVLLHALPEQCAKQGVR